MLALVEGRHATGDNAFHVSTESNEEDNIEQTQANAANHDGLASVGQSFYNDDWVCFLCSPIHGLINYIIFIEFLLAIFSQGDKELQTRHINSTRSSHFTKKEESPFGSSCSSGCCQCSS